MLSKIIIALVMGMLLLVLYSACEVNSAIIKRCEDKGGVWVHRLHACMAKGSIL